MTSMTGLSCLFGLIVCLVLHLTQCHETHSIFNEPRALADSIGPCAVEDADAEELLRLKAAEEDLTTIASQKERGFSFQLLCAFSYRFCNADIVIPVYAHNIQDGATGRLSQSDIRDMLRQTNRKFRFSGIRLDLKEIKYVNSKAWYNASVSSPAEIEMMSKLKIGGLDTMNVYLKKAIGSNGGIYCGYTNLGAYAAQVGVRDGIVVHPDCAADGKSFPHEVGHYLNLHHTFAGGCSPGDLVDDTPPQLKYVGRNKECPALFPDTCPDDSGRDPLDNMMDYNPQDCRNVFTNGQIQRMRDAWVTFRDPRTRI